jgi:sigma-B regulation protein RsbU (phosphoserine phosphatase)
MAQAVSTLRLILRPQLSPATALARWNEMIYGSTIRGMFITALLGRIDVSECQVELASAGHSQPLLVRSGGVVEELAVPGSPPLGILPSRTAQSQTHRIAPGEWLVSYTDGLSESFDCSRRPLDGAGIRSLLSRPFSAAQDLVDTLLQGEEKHRGEADPHDDLTTLVAGCS